MLSKELLSEVLGYKVSVTRIGNVDYNNNLLYDLSSDDTESINIYEIADKCKKYALSNSYIIGTIDREVIVYSREYRVALKVFIGNISETQAIFKACQWILDNKENNA